MTIKLTKKDVLNDATYKLVNKAENQELLNSVPHKDFLDLAAIYYIHMDENCIGIINNSIMRRLNIKMEELEHAAYINTRKNLIIEPMMSILGTCGLPIFFPEDDNLMYVGTNETICYGAAILLYSEYFAGLSETTKTNLFVLPSSVHDVIIVPDNGSVDAVELKTMVKEINRNSEIIKKEDVLSDSVYYYSRHSGKIEIIK